MSAFVVRVFCDLVAVAILVESSKGGGERSVKWKRRQNTNRTGTIAGSLLSRAP